MLLSSAGLPDPVLTIPGVALPPDQLLPTGQRPIDVQVGLLNDDRLNDLAVLNADGTLITALNNGLNHWINAQQLSLGIGPVANGMTLGLFDNTHPFNDVAVQSPNAITIFRGDGTGNFTTAQTLTPDSPGQLAPTGGGHVQLAAGQFNSDFFQDLVTVSPGTNEVLVYLGNGSGTFGAPIRFASGANQPDAVVVGDFLGDSFLDLAVGHRDGTVTFFQGNGDGTFLARPDLTVSGLGAVASLAVGNFNGHNNAIAAATTQGVTLLDNHHQPPANPIPNGSFAAGLAGWTVSSGQVHASNGVVQFQEDSSVLTSTLQKTFVVPDRPQTLSFDLLSLGLEAPAGGVPDAFEVSLLDANQNSVVPTWSSQATSFYNANPGNVVSTAAGVTVNGTRITLDISHLTPGSQPTLFFDLVGNPPGTGSVASIANVQVTQQPPTEPFTVTSLAGPFGTPTAVAAGDVNGDGHLDLVVTDSGLNKLIAYDGDGTGSFTRSDGDLSPFGSGPSWVAVGHLTAGATAADIAVTLADNNFVLNPLIFDTIPPQATLFSPSPGQLLDEGISQVQVQFSKNVLDKGPTADHSVTNPASYVLTNTDTHQQIPLASVSYDPNTFRATLLVASGSTPLFDGHYQVVVKGNDAHNAIEDLGFNLLNGGSDTTGAFTIDATPPQVTMVNPVAGQTTTAAVSQIQVQFSEAMADAGPNADHSVTNAAGYILIGSGPDGVFESGGDDVTIPIAAVTYNPATLSAVLTIGSNSVSLAYSSYQLIIQGQDSHYGLQDIAGNRVHGGLDTTFTFQVVNVAPTILTGSDLSGMEGQNLTFVGTFTDVNTQDTHTAQFTWGDGTFSAGTVVESGGQGTVTATHTYLEQGTYSITLMVTDTGGLSDSRTAGAIINNAPPTLTLSGASTVTEGGSYTLSLSALYVNDPDGDAIHSWIVTWGDGAIQTVVGNPPSVTHVYGDGPASYTISATASDDDGSYTASNTVTVSVTTVAPTLTLSGASTVTVGAVYTLNLSAVYTNDPDGDAIQSWTVTWGDGEAQTVIGNPSSVTHVYTTGPTQVVISATATDDDATFNAGNTVNVQVLTSGSTKFLVVDQSAHGTFRYDTMGNFVNETDLSQPKNSRPRGIASNANGDTFWVIDANKLVFVYNADGSLRGSWAATGLNQPQDITTNGTDIWIVDSAKIDQVKRYAGAASRISGTQDPAQTFTLESQNNNPSGIVTDGATLWVTDDFNHNDNVFVYTLAGVELGKWLLDASDTAPSGITLNPTGGTDLWVVDRHDGLVYHYAGATTRRTGSQAASDTFALASSDHHPEGIADPPPSGSAIGQVVSGTLSAPGQADAYAFNGTAGQQLFFDVQNNNAGTIDFALLQPDGTPLLRSYSSDRDTFALATTGTYTMVVIAQGNHTATGPYQFQIDSVPSTVPAPITVGQTVAGTIGVPGQQDRYTFTGTAGQQLFFDVLNSGAGSLGFTVLQPNNATLLAVSNQNQGNSFVLPNSGTYTVVVGHTAALDATGPYQFQLDSVPANVTQAITQNTSVSGNLTVPGQTITYTFHANLGQQVLFQTLNNPGLVVGFTLRDPSGNTLFANQLGDALIASLPATGTYTLVAQANGDQVGAFGFEIVDQSSLSPTANLDPPFAIGDVVSGSLPTTSSTATWTFLANAGQRVVFNVQVGASTTFFWTLTGPDGRTVFQNQPFHSEGPVVLRLTGQYSLKIQSQAGGTGNYAFQAQNVAMPASVPIAIGAVISGQIATPTDVFVYTFTPAAGQWVFFDAPFNTIVHSELLDPNGQVVFNTKLDRNGALQLAVAGSYRVIITPQDDPLGFQNPVYFPPPTTYQFQLVNEVPPVPVTIAVGDQVQGTIQNPGDVNLYAINGTAGQFVFCKAPGGSLLSSIHWELAAPNGKVLFSSDTFNNQPTVILPETGVYTLLIVGRFGFTGSYSFQTVNITPAVPVPITPGNPVSVTISTLGQLQLYTYAANAGDQFSVTVSGSSSFSFSVLAPDGSVIAGPSNTSLSTFTVPQTGTYTIRVGSTFTASGSFQFTLNHVPVSPPVPIMVNQVVSGTISVAGQQPRYTLSGTLGERLFLDFQNNSGFALGITLLRPDGSVLLPNSSVSHDTFVLDATGTFTFLVGAGPFAPSSSTGPYQFEVWQVPPDVTQAITLDVPVAGTVQTPGQRLTYQFQATVGAQVLFDIKSNSGGVPFTLYDPSGTPLQLDPNSSSFGVTTSQLITSLPATGMYTLVAAGIVNFTGVHGPISFQLQEVAAPTLGVDDSKGTNFWLAFPQNFRDFAGGFNLQPPATPTLYLSADQDASGTVFVPGTGFMTSFFVTAGTVTTITLPTGLSAVELNGSSAVENKGIHVRSLQEVSVYGVSLQPFATDGFLGLPADVLGTQYVDLGFGGKDGGALARGSELAVVATVDGTTVTITPSITVDTHAAGVPFTVLLNAGQTYQLLINGSPDLSGTLVQADQPIAVYGGHEAANIPIGASFANYLVEQLTPVAQWGRHFVTMPLATRQGGDLFRFLAATDGTHIHVNGTLVATLNAGQFFDQNIAGPAEITADQPILVAQFAYSNSFDGVTGDPTMMLVPSVDQYLSSYTVATPASGFPENFLNIVAPQAAAGTILLDGIAIPAAQFTPIGGSGFVGVQLAVNVGSHHLSGPTPFGLFVYGFATYDAYGFPGGFQFAHPVVASHVALTPKTATDLVNTVDSVLATVTDSSNNPVAGVRVDFQVTGANTASGFAVTDTSGQASFTYTGTHLGTDTILATAATLTDTASVSWYGAPPTVAFSSPTPGSTLAAGNFIIVTGQAQPGSPLAPITLITVNGQAVDAVDAAGDFFAKVNVASGTNVFTVQVTDSLGQSVSATLTLIGGSGSALPSGQLQDVTLLGQLSYTGTTFNRHTQRLVTQATLTDTSNVLLAGAVEAVVSPIAPLAVTLANAAGQTPDNKPFVTFLGGSGTQPLTPGGSSSPVTVMFQDGTRDRFNFGVTLLAPGNTPPVFSSAPNTQAGVGATYTYQAVASDADGDAATFRLPVAPEGMTINAQTGQITWTPTASQVGVQQVQVVADDGRGGTATQTFSLQVSVNPTNRTPVFQSVPVVQVAPGALYVYNAVAVDPDGDTLHYFLDNAPTGMTVNAATGQVTYQTSAAGTFSVQLRADDGHGGSTVQAYVLAVGAGNSAAVTTASTPPTSAVVGIPYVYLPHALDANGQALQFSLVSAPSGMTINSATGRVDWTPAAGQVGPRTVVLEVADALGANSLQTFTVTVASQLPDLPPVFQSLPVTLATQDMGYSYTPQVLEPESQAVQFTLVKSPSGMTINGTSGANAWTPAAGDIGPHQVTIRATDPAGNAGAQSFLLFVRGPNVPPTLTSSPLTTVTAGTTYRYTVAATDAFDGFTFHLVNGPTGMTVDPLSGSVLWQPTVADLGAYPVDIRLTNDRGAVVDQTFTLTVAPDSQPPTVSVVLSSDVTLPGQAIAVHVLASDNVGVTAVTLAVNGIPVVLDANNSATVTPGSPGKVSLVASAFDAGGNMGTALATLRVTDPSDTTAPTIEITSPISGDPVTYLTQIVGTVTDPNLDFYQMQYARAGTTEFTTFFTGTTSVVHGVLGTFDPTLLMNDDYTIRVVAQDISGNVATQDVTVGVQGNAKLGNFHLEYTDLQIPVAGIPITITRVYDTLQAGLSGDFGYGWRLGVADPQIHETLPVDPRESLNGIGMFAARPFKIGTRVYITNPDGKREGFTFNPVDVGGFIVELWQPQFTPDFGVTDTLTDGFPGLAGNSVRLVQEPDGSFQLYGIAVPYNPEDYRLTTKDGTAYRYNQFTGLQDITDRNGNVLTFTATGITSSTGQSIQFVRDAQGRITQIIDPNGHALDYAYDAHGDLTAFTDQAGLTSTYTYRTDHPHYLDSMTDAQGHRALKTAYDDQGRLASTQDALGDAVTRSYDLTHFQETFTDPLGKISQLTYDLRGNIVSTTDPLGHTTTAVYDANDNVTRVTNALGDTTSLAYDGRRNVTSVTDALGGVSTFAYNSFNEVTQAVDPLGRIITSRYDAQGNLLQFVNAAGVSSYLTHDAQGRPTSATDNNGFTTLYSYATGLSLPSLVTNPDGSTRGLDYNDFGELSRVTDELGNAVDFTYDDSGRLLTIRDPNNGVIGFTYNGELLGSKTDPLGHVTRYGYDAANRRVSATDALGGLTQHTYDAANHEIAITDALGHTTTTAYRDDGRVSAVTDALGGVTSYEYVSRTKF